MRAKKWGGVRKPTSGKRLGRPPNGGREISVRLPPFLVVALGIKTKKNAIGSDATRIKTALFKAILYVKSYGANEGDSIAQLQPARSPYGSSKRGWTELVSMTNIWVSPEIDQAIGSVRGDGENDSNLIKRLLTIAVALEGWIEESETIPSYEDYLKGAIGQEESGDSQGLTILPKSFKRKKK